MTEPVEIARKAKTVDSHRLASVGCVRGSNRLTALLLELEPLIAIDVEMTLESSGFEVKGVISCGEAHTWLDRYLPNVAIVDVNLRDGPCTDVVSRLIRAKIPFVVHSVRHQRDFMASPFASGVWVSKPSVTEDLAGAVRAVVSGLF